MEVFQQGEGLSIVKRRSFPGPESPTFADEIHTDLIAVLLAQGQQQVPNLTIAFQLATNREPHQTKMHHRRWKATLGLWSDKGVRPTEDIGNLIPAGAMVCLGMRKRQLLCRRGLR